MKLDGPAQTPRRGVERSTPSCRAPLQSLLYLERHVLWLMLWEQNGSGNSREQRRRVCRRSNVPAVVDPYGPFDSVAGAMSTDSLSATIAEPDPLAPFYVGFTSGSTGAPKGYPRHYQS